MELIFFTIFVITAAVFVYAYEKKLKQQKAWQAQVRAESAHYIIAHFEHIKFAVADFSRHQEYSQGYFNHAKFEAWKRQYEVLYNEVRSRYSRELQLDSEVANAVEDFLAFYTEGENIRGEYNEQYIQLELQRYYDLFDNVEGRKLDQQQRRAIVTDEDNNLVVAGAGSGKTTTIAGKVKYLLQRYHINPDQILLISFTRKASDEMKKRIKDKMGIDIDVMTFHKLGKEIIAEVEGRQPSVFDEDTLKKHLNDIITQLLSNEVFLHRMVEYFSKFLKPQRLQSEFSSHGAYIQYLKDSNQKSYKAALEENRSLNQEVLKSTEEVLIANFLYLNNIAYEYEAPYEHETVDRFHRQYKPDFYLPEYGIYIEHFALVDRQGNVPRWFGNDYHAARKEYISGIKWKRNIHKQYETGLVETYSYENKEGVLLPNLKIKLEQCGVRLSPKSPQEIWSIIHRAQNTEVEEFFKLLSTFLTLYKSNDFSPEELVNKNSIINNRFHQQRNLAFLGIFLPVLQNYEALLAKRMEIDFSDMINRAARYVREAKYPKHYKYIIIDEFQDISVGRYKLVESIRGHSPGCKVFCVGDDWQSIYRFAGSDISLFTDFDSYFGYTARMYIEKTYRFDPSIIELSSEFIQKNQKQIRKTLKSDKKSEGQSYKIVLDKNEKNSTHAIRGALNEIVESIHITGTTPERILILGRYLYDLDMIKNDAESFSVHYDRSQEVWKITYKLCRIQLNIEFLTVHKAKGLEAEYVIVLNCNSGKYGFPCELSDDPVLELVLTQADSYENAEERRLFYVAMTRTKKQLYLIAKEKYKSKFIVELEGGKAVSLSHCPKCKLGGLLGRVSAHGPFVGCSNYPYCDYSYDPRRPRKAFQPYFVR